MKLIIAIVSNDDKTAVNNELVKARFKVTELSTTGGFLQKGNTTMLIGVDNDRVDDCIAVIKQYSRKRVEKIPDNAFSFNIGLDDREVKVGGATLFVLDIEQFIKL